MKGIPKNAICLEETTVEEINGVRVGSGNYFTRERNDGKRAPSIQVSLWLPGSEGDYETRIIFEGDEIVIAGSRYRLISIDPGSNGELGKACLVPDDSD